MTNTKKQAALQGVWDATRLFPFSLAVGVCSGFGLVGPMEGYGGYSSFSKLVLTFAMLFGRLEIYPILLALYPRTWTKK